MAEGNSSTGDMASALHAAMGSGGTDSGSSPNPTPTPSPTPSVPAAASPPASGSAAPTGTAPTTPAEPDLQKEFPDGRIPLTRHQEILQTTRQKQLEAARQQILEEFGPWNRLRAQFTPQEFEQIIEGLQEFHKNPHAWMRRVAPELGYQLYTPGQFPGQPPGSPYQQPVGQTQVQPTGEMPGPDLQFQGSDGQTYQTYSAEQNRKLQEWYAKQQESKVQQMLDPWLKQQQAQARQQFLAQIDRQAVEDVERASKNWEGFDELRPHMHRLMAADKRVTLESAYRTAYNEHYLPIRDQRIIDKHDQELKQRAAAVQTPVSPTTRPAAAPGAVPSDQRKSIREQFKEKLSEFFPRTA